VLDVNSDQCVRLLLAGALLRSCKELWRDCFLLACAAELAATYDSRVAMAGPSDCPQLQESGVKRPRPHSAVAPEEPTAENAAAIAFYVNSPIFVDRVLRYAKL
jgi:hypothetical protein